MLHEINYFQKKDYLCFQISARQESRQHLVMYNLKKKDVLCTCTTSMPCSHVRFLFEMFNDNETWQMQDLIQDWTKWRPQIIEINEMYLALQKAAYKKQKPAMLETTNRLMGEIKKSRTSTRKTSPSPFSLIELD